jgi:Cof subfamily protein (haloacid dehalogenase superfamily)
VTAFRLLALDIDGTLLRSDKTVSPRTLQALSAAQRAGARIVLITGRRYPAARRVAAQLPCETDLVLHNGALIMEGDAVLRCRTLDREVARRAVRVGRAAGADPVVHYGRAGEGLLMVQGGVAPSNTLLAYYLDRSHQDVRNVPDLEAAMQEDPIQVMYGGGLAEMAGLRARLERELAGSARVERTVYPHLGVALLDVLDPAVGKAEALSFLQARFQVDASQTLAIGDNWNDHEMLAAAGLGLVMGNADPEMLALGLPVLPTNDEDGVAVAIEEHVLHAKK